MTPTPNVSGANWDVELMAAHLSRGIRNSAVSNPRDMGFEMQMFWLPSLYLLLFHFRL